MYLGDFSILRRLVYVLLFCLPTGWLSAQLVVDKVSSTVASKMEEDQQSYIPVVVSLHEQVDARALKTQYARLRSSKAERITQTIQALQNKAKPSQTSLLEKIRRFGGFAPGSLQSFWIFNGLVVEARPELIAYLSRQPEVHFIEWDAPITVYKSDHDGQFLDPGVAEPALRTLNVHKLWEMGYTGYGTKVLIIDTGVDWQHPALRSQSAYNTETLRRSTSGSLIGDYSDEHGTAVAGAILGLERPTQDTLGPAFNTRYLDGPASNAVNSSSEYEGSARTALANLQWALNPDQNINTTDDVPDVINNSWGIANLNASDCTNSFYRDVIGSLDAAGVSVLFAAGNEGPNPETINLPAGLHISPYVPLSVGATNEGELITNFSSRGPTPCQSGENAIKPEVVAPGQRIRTTSLFGRYSRISGTSFSTPYVTGIILLLKEAFPNLEGSKLQEAVVESARDLGSPGPDNNYGYGMVDALAAFEYLVDQGFTPSSPEQSNNDIVLVDAQTNLRNCDRQASITLTIANDGTVPIRTFDILLRNGVTGDLISTTTWNGTLQPNEVRQISPTSFDAFLGNYTVQVSLENPNGSVDRRNLNNHLKFDINVTNDPIFPTVLPDQDQACQGEQVLLRATGDGIGQVNWYDDARGGTLISDQPNFLTEPLTQDQSFFATLAFNRKAGLSNPQVGTNGFLAPEAGLEFDVFSPFTLKSVLIYPEEAGACIIVLREPDGQTQQRIINVTNTDPQRIDLDFRVDIGEGYELLVTVGKPLAITTTNVNYPVTIDGVLAIRKSVGTVATFYPYFYDWEIEYEYPCGRVAVPVAVSNTPAPSVDFSVVEHLTSGQTFDFQDLSPNAVSWSWSFGDGSVASTQNPSHTYTEAGTFMVQLTITDANGCSNTATAEVTVDPLTNTREEHLWQERITVVPNPFSDYIQVAYQMDRPMEMEFRLTNLTGQVLQVWRAGRQQSGTHDYSVFGLPPGAYFLIIQAGDRRISKKLVKTR